MSQPGLVMEAPAPAVSINFFESIGLSKSYSSCVNVFGWLRGRKDELRCWSGSAGSLGKVLE